MSHSTETKPFVLPALPYEENALAPYISANTISFHYGKHHNAYVNKLNELVAGTPLADASLEEIITSTANDAQKAGVFNNAAQVWNHTFYWKSLSPKGGGKPGSELAKKLDEAFGGYDAFVKEFANVGMAQFGSGWAWLIVEGGSLKITKTPNAVNPLSQGRQALLTIDVWEHAYYLDYQNKRNEYLEQVLANLLNWEFAEKNLAA